MRSNRRYSRAFTTIGVSLIATFAAAGGIQVVSATTAGAAGNVPAHAARVLKATDTAKLHYVSAAGASLREEGPTAGTLPGKMKVSMDVGTTFSGTFTIYLKGGTITGHGTATPHGVGVLESFAGTLVVTKGTGRYSRAGGHAGLYGTFNRNSYALTIQTTGNLSY